MASTTLYAGMNTDVTMVLQKGARRTNLFAACSILAIMNTGRPEEPAMSRSTTTTMTVRISGALSEFVATNVGANGAYENISEYVRDLIRRDKERADREAFERLRAELTHAFAAPEAGYKPLTAAEVIARNRV